MSEFWGAFLPNAAATLIGVIVGVPVALLVNRAALRATIRREELLNSARLRSGLESILGALSHNQNQLRLLAARFGQDRLPFEASLDASAWDESRDEIAGVLKTPDLQRRIAWHFSRLKSFLRLNALYIELAVSAGTGAHIAPDAGKEDLRTHLTREIRDLLADIDPLKAELQTFTHNVGEK